MTVTARHRILLALAVLAALAIFALGCGARVGALKEAASADFNCPMSRIKVHSGGKSVRDVEGCGQRATYTVDDGEWRMIARSALQPVGAQPVVGRPAPGPTPQAAPMPAPVRPSPTSTPSQPPPSNPGDPPVKSL